MTAAWTPAPGGFLERNPHLIENYLAVCAELGETPGEVPEEVGAVGRERPPERVFEEFRRLHMSRTARVLRWLDWLADLTQSSAFCWFATGMLVGVVIGWWRL